MTPTFAEMAETVTDETLPNFLHRLSSRPEPHDLQYEALLFELAAETLNRTPFSIFRLYCEQTGFQSPEIAEILWQRSFPEGVLAIRKPKPDNRWGVVLHFPIEESRRHAEGVKG